MHLRHDAKITLIMVGVFAVFLIVYGIGAALGLF
jgi:hypothetical protein